MGNDRAEVQPESCTNNIPVLIPEWAPFKALLSTSVVNVWHRHPGGAPWSRTRPHEVALGTFGAGTSSI
jgi:hypothetical protein